MKFARIIIFAVCIAGAFYFFYPRHTKQFSSCDDLASFCKYKMYDDLVKVWGEPTEKKEGLKEYYIRWRGVGINGVDKTLIFELDYIGNGSVAEPFRFQGVECDSNPSATNNDSTQTENNTPGVDNSTNTYTAIDTQSIQASQKPIEENSTSSTPDNAASESSMDSVELISTVVERGGKMRDVLTSKLPVTYCSGKLRYTFKMQNDTLKCDFADEGGYYLTLPCVQTSNIVNLVGNNSFFAISSGLLWFVNHDQHYKLQLYTCK